VTHNISAHVGMLLMTLVREFLAWTNMTYALKVGDVHSGLHSDSHVPLIQKVHECALRCRCMRLRLVLGKRTLQETSCAISWYTPPALLVCAKLMRSAIVWYFHCTAAQNL